MLFVSPDFQEIIKLIAPFWDTCDHMKMWKEKGKWFAKVVEK